METSERFDFYLGRLAVVHHYGFVAGEAMLSTIHSCAYYDRDHDYLTHSEFMSIINLCQAAHIKLMEENYNAGWND